MGVAGEVCGGGSVGISYFALLDARNSDVKKKALSIRLSQKIFEE